ncbi:unnamed protein product [Rotaria socialis]|uniref:Uncharacterized protein n=1 Tax=Rotaria socialis TaxID=392032 RepID=A0A818UU02_9BILA|nr:unnamed protein product [Rotaria socialis]CAF3392864.1 unnamed protein product [Rotaria socialis]CAF3424818.1 unnamed protein product [Rotaria socialis]CAF3475172.1 unnamed protein product [Rotaria socialis]CAF3702885.1 unnamed protein product [Rotaria socialis]
MAEKQMDEDIVFAEMSNLMEQWKQKQITCEEFVAANQALIHKKYNLSIVVDQYEMKIRSKEMIASNEEINETVPDEKSSKQRIIDLSLKYNIFSRHTIFIAIEKTNQCS